MLKGDGTVLFNGKWESRRRQISNLSWNMAAALDTHLRNLAEGRDVMERFNFKESETQFFRGQPETHFESLDPRNGNITVYLLGLGHWQIFKSGVRDKGTRYVDNLQSTLLKVIVWDDEQLEV